MREAKLGLVALPGDFEDDVGAVPFVLSLTKLMLASVVCQTTFLPGTNSVILCVLR